MATYVFKAMDLTGAKARGEVEAESKQVVADQLKPRGLIVLDIEDKHALQGDQRSTSCKRIKPTDLTVMTRQLATMVSSGMTILRALYVLEEQTENKLLAEITRRGPQGRRGRPRRSATRSSATPRSSTPLFVAMTRAGETGGVLEESLLRVADQLEKEDSLRRQVKSAMVYPCVVMTFALRRPARAGGVPRPGLRRRLQGVRRRAADDHASSPSALSNVMTGYWWAAASPVAVGIVVGFRKWKTQRRGAARSGTRFRLRIPMKIGDIVQKVALARWSRTFSALVTAGVPLLAALDITGQDRRQPRRREGDGRRHRVASSAAARSPSRCKRGPRLPGHGRPHGRRRRGDRRPGHDALQDRRLLRGPGRRRRSRR